MDIFTDASLNDKKKIAGVSAVFVPQKANTFTCYHSYCSVSKIETAELLAIASALSMIDPKADKDVRIISDSKGALRKIQRIFHHPKQKQIHTIKDSMQKKIMYNISSSFSKKIPSRRSPISIISTTLCCLPNFSAAARNAQRVVFSELKLMSLNFTTSSTCESIGSRRRIFCFPVSG